MLGIVDAMCCTSVSRQHSQALYSSYVVTSSELATRASGRWSGFRAASAGWLVVPRSNRGLDLLAHHESCGSSRQRNRYISDLSCLSASHVCVHWNPIAGFLRENLISLLLLRWLAGSGQGVGGSYFYFGEEEQSTGSRRMKQTFVVMTMF